MAWEWAKVNEMGVAKFATAEAANQLFQLDVSSFDLKQQGEFEALIKAIYETLVKQKIQYDFQLKSSSDKRQRIRTPVEILQQSKRGTCLDLALLFCGLCLGYGLLPKLVILEGHAIAMVSLILPRSKWDSNEGYQKEFLGNRIQTIEGINKIKPALLKDVERLEEMVTDNELCAIECTGFAWSKTINEGQESAGLQRDSEGYLSFEQAKEAGLKQLDQFPLEYAIDIEVAHEYWGIEPEKITIPSDLHKTRVPILADPLPYYYVPRPEHSEAVKAELLGTRKNATGTLVVSAIYGLGGIGKSVLARAIAHDPEVQEHFKDGILWVTLGQDPDLLPEISLWLQALGDYNSKPTAIDSATLQLRLLLQEKRMLLVIDDVWEAEHAKPFRVGGKDCCVLITTREAAIEDGNRYSLNEMTAQQSLTLLTQKLRQELTPADAKQANTLAQKVGYLPLALELAAAQIEDDVEWVELLKDLDEEIANLDTLNDPLLAFEGDQPERKIRNRSLYASFNLSLKRLPPDQIKQFAWLGILPEDVAINAAVASKLWDIKPRQARTLLQGFMRKSLLMKGLKQAGQGVTYRMHDLVHDIAQCMLTHDPDEEGVLAYGAMGLSLAEAHSILLERYIETTANGLWHELEDDGYIFAQLTWHMKQAGQEAEIHQLLQETTAEGRNGWYEACERLQLTSVFINTLERAWDLACQSFKDKEVQAISLLFRYSLIKTSFSSRVDFPAEFLAVLVKHQKLKSDQGLEYARYIPDSSRKRKALESLKKFLMINAKDNENILQEIRRAIEEIEISELNESDKTLNAIGEIDIYDSELLTSQSWQESVSSILAPTTKIKPKQNKKLLNLIQEIENLENPSEILDVITSNEEFTRRDRYLEKMLIKVAPYLHEEKEYIKALTAAREMGSNFQARTIAALINQLPDSSDKIQSIFLEETYNSIFLIQNDELTIVKIHIDILEKMDLDRHKDFIFEETNKLLQKEWSFIVDEAEALTYLAPYIPEKLEEEAFNKAIKIKGEMSGDDRFKPLIQLIPYFSISFKNKIIGTIKKDFVVLDSREKPIIAKLLAEISSLIPVHYKEVFFESVLEFISSLEYDTSKVEIIRDILPNMTSSSRWKIARIIMGLKINSQEIIDTMLDLKSLFSPEAAIKKSLKYVKDINFGDSERERNDYLKIILKIAKSAKLYKVESVLESIFDGSIELILGLEDKQEQAHHFSDFIVTFFDYLEKESRDKILDFFAEIRDSFLEANILIDIFINTDEEHQDFIRKRILGIFSRISDDDSFDDDSFAKLLEKTLFYCSDSLLIKDAINRAEIISNNIKNPSLKVRLLLSMIPQLSERENTSIYDEILCITLSIEDSRERESLLRRIANQLENLEQEEAKINLLNFAWARILGYKGNTPITDSMQTRKDLLSNINSFSVTLHLFEEKDLIYPDFIDSISKIQYWWP